MSTIKPFARQGNYVIFDVALIDYLMPELSSTAWKILSYIVRQTRGWQREEAPLSYKDIMKGTGVSSSATIKSGLTELEERKIIIVDRPSDTWSANSYSLNRDYELTIGKSKPPASKIEEPTSKIEAEPTSEIEVYNNNTKKRDTKDRDFLYLLPGQLSNSPNFVSIWKDWAKFRRERKKPLTETTVKRQVSKLKKWPEDIAIAMVDQSINNSWQGIFELNPNHPLMRNRQEDLADAGAVSHQQLRSA